MSEASIAEHYKTCARWRSGLCAKIRFLPTITNEGRNNVKIYFFL